MEEIRRNHHHQSRFIYFLFLFRFFILHPSSSILAPPTTHNHAIMSPPADSKFGKRESGTARVLGSGASGVAELMVFHPVVSSDGGRGATVELCNGWRGVGESIRRVALLILISLSLSCPCCHVGHDRQTTNVQQIRHHFIKHQHHPLPKQRHLLPPHQIPLALPRSRLRSGLQDRSTSVQVRWTTLLPGLDRRFPLETVLHGRVWREERENGHPCRCGFFNRFGRSRVTAIGCVED
jgi:hypothetical protein